MSKTKNVRRLVYGAMVYLPIFILTTTCWGMYGNENAQTMGGTTIDSDKRDKCNAGNEIFKGRETLQLSVGKQKIVIDLIDLDKQAVLYCLPQFKKIGFLDPAQILDNILCSLNSKKDTLFEEEPLSPLVQQALESIVQNSLTKRLMIKKDLRTGKKINESTYQRSFLRLKHIKKSKKCLSNEIKCAHKEKLEKRCDDIEQYITKELLEILPSIKKK